MKYLYILNHGGGIGVCVQISLTDEQAAAIDDDDVEAFEGVMEDLEDKHHLNIQNQEWIRSDEPLETH